MVYGEIGELKETPFKLWKTNTARNNIFALLDLEMQSPNMTANYPLMIDTVYTHAFYDYKSSGIFKLKVNNLSEPSLIRQKKINPRNLSEHPFPFTVKETSNK